MPQLFALMTGTFCFWSESETRFPEQKDKVPIVHNIKLSNAKSETWSSGKKISAIPVNPIIDAISWIYLGLDLVSKATMIIFKIEAIENTTASKPEAIFMLA